MPSILPIDHVTNRNLLVKLIAGVKKNLISKLFFNYKFWIMTKEKRHSWEKIIPEGRYQYFASWDDLYSNLKDFSSPDYLIIIADAPCYGGIFEFCDAHDIKEWTGGHLFCICSDCKKDSIRKLYALGAQEVCIDNAPLDILQVKLEHMMNVAEKKNNRVDLINNRCWIQGTLIEGLTTMELKLIQLFIDSKNMRLTKSEMIDKIWPGEKVDKKNINVHLHNLRKKLNHCGLNVHYSTEGNWSLTKTA